MQVITKIIRTIVILAIMTIVAGVLYFSPVKTATYHANRVQKTELRAYSAEKCVDACVLVSQGDAHRSTATRIHTDTFRAFVPPAGLMVATKLATLIVFYICIHFIVFKKIRHVQQEYAIWRF